MLQIQVLRFVHLIYLIVLGGRIGSSGGDPDPDLRNLGVYYFPCQQKDIIFLLSDGAHDNLGLLKASFM